MKEIVEIKELKDAEEYISYVLLSLKTLRGIIVDIQKELLKIKEDITKWPSKHYLI